MADANHQGQDKHTNNAFHIAWYEGKLSGVPGHLKFTYADTGRTVPADAAPPFDVIAPERRFMLKDHSNWWLGAYCRTQEEFRQLTDAVTAISAEFGQDPPGVARSFPGEGFYFLTSMTRAPATK